MKFQIPPTAGVVIAIVSLQLLIVLGLSMFVIAFCQLIAWLAGVDTTFLYLVLHRVGYAYIVLLVLFFGQRLLNRGV